MLAARVEPKNGPKENKKTDNFKPLVLSEFQAAVDTSIWPYSLLGSALAFRSSSMVALSARDRRISKGRKVIVHVHVSVAYGRVRRSISRRLLTRCLPGPNERPPNSG